MTVESTPTRLAGKKALVIGIANDQSIAYGCAKAFHARLAAPLMTEGGTLFAMTFNGANAVVPNYDLMGPIKAALESSCRYLAFELGGQGIRVHAISPGPLKTRAASGIKDFDAMLDGAAQRAPLGELVDIMDVGHTCAFLASPEASRLTGSTMYVDGALHVMG